MQFIWLAGQRQDGRFGSNIMINLVVLYIVMLINYLVSFATMWKGHAQTSQAMFFVECFSLNSCFDEKYFLNPYDRLPKGSHHLRGCSDIPRVLVSDRTIAKPYLTWQYKTCRENTYRGRVQCKRYFPHECIRRKPYQHEHYFYHILGWLNTVLNTMWHFAR